LHDISAQLALRASIERENRNLKISNRELQDLSRTDALTRIANRRCFDEILDQEIKRSARNRDELSLILLDIDFFKLYNDHYGHSKGDDCLIEVAGEISGHFTRATDLAARYGGEEFAIVLPATGIRNAEKLAESLRVAIASRELPHEKSPVASHVTISAGITTVAPGQAGSTDSEKIIQAADKALYQAKEAGRNRVCVLPLPTD